MAISTPVKLTPLNDSITLCIPHSIAAYLLGSLSLILQSHGLIARTSDTMYQGLTSQQVLSLLAIYEAL
jgi:hypothetical protein